MPSGHKSQSEQDWAYAKHALARGDDPEAVIQRIAEFRSEDKDDPSYYARHTVKKAIAEIGVQSSGATPMLHSEERDDREPGR